MHGGRILSPELDLSIHILQPLSQSKHAGSRINEDGWPDASYRELYVVKGLNKSFKCILYTDKLKNEASFCNLKGSWFNATFLHIHKACARVGMCVSQSCRWDLASPTRVDY